MSRPIDARKLILQKTPERDVSEGCCRVLEQAGFLVFRRNVGAMTTGKRHIRFSEPGASDRWAIAPEGWHLELEIKRFGKRPTLDQVRWLMRLNGHGRARALWVDQVETLERLLPHLLAGARVVYRTDQRPYRLRDGSRVLGPCGDYDLVYDPDTTEDTESC